jgi:NAD(P)-dependent dehydrogenase (short-subunit alcohol dehydrogenase family)
MKTVLITGCSSGFGLATATHFLEQGWQVIATMRTPQADLLPASEQLRVLPLDVTDAQSIRTLVEAAGPIDVLVNNAGIGVLGAFEATPMQTVRDIFDTNTFGLMALTQAFLPQFRQRKAGVIVNVTSAVTFKPFVLLASYTASKAAVEAFTECLALEVQGFGVRACVVQPGLGPGTKFGENAKSRMDGLIPEDYADVAEAVFAGMKEPASVTHPIDVAKAVWRAATDVSSPLFMPAGEDSVALAAQVAAPPVFRHA